METMFLTPASLTSHKKESTGPTKISCAQKMFLLLHLLAYDMHFEYGKG